MKFARLAGLVGEERGATLKRGGAQEPGQEIFLVIVHIFSPYMHPLQSKLSYSYQSKLGLKQSKASSGTPPHFVLAPPSMVSMVRSFFHKL